MNTRLYKKIQGFTLIEALIAVTIVALSVTGPLYTANRALVVAQNSRNQLTASYLAQEGIETIRLLRDNRFLGSQDTPLAWADFLGDVANPNLGAIDCSSPGACSVDYDPVNSQFGLLECSDPDSCLKLNRSTSGIYSTDSGGTQTPFEAVGTGGAGKWYRKADHLKGNVDLSR